MSDLYVNDLFLIGPDDISCRTVVTVLWYDYWELLSRGTISITQTQTTTRSNTTTINNHTKVKVTCNNVTTTNHINRKCYVTKTVNDAEHSAFTLPSHHTQIVNMSIYWVATWKCMLMTTRCDFETLVCDKAATLESMVTARQQKHQLNKCTMG